MAKSESEWDRRTLCSDGNCIGIIGADGRCKVCGLPYDGELPSSAADSLTVDDGEDDPVTDQQMTEEDDVVGDDPAVDSQTSGDEWEKRTLCIDESCIGVVGPEGHCKVCGKPYPGYLP